jgi:hypothetical protein
MDIELRRAYRRAHRNPNVPERPCAWCHIVFTPKRRTSITCCRSCYKHWHYHQQTEAIACRHCHTPFTPSIHFHSYCSPACRAGGRKHNAALYNQRRHKQSRVSIPVGRHERKTLCR